MDEGFGPLLRRLLVDEIEQLASGLCGREGPLGFDDFAQLTMVTLDGVGGVDETTDFAGILKQSGQVFRVVFPSAYGHGVAVVPGFGQLQEVAFRLFSSCCLVDGFEVGDKPLRSFQDTYLRLWRI